MCQCGALVHVDNGKAVKIEGDTNHPYNHGFMCPKGLSALETVYFPTEYSTLLKKPESAGRGNGSVYPGMKPSKISGSII